MEETPKELTMKELLELVQRQEGEFMIRIDVTRHFVVDGKSILISTV